MVKVLFIGDVVSDPGCKTVRKFLPQLKKNYDIDLVIANAENSAVGNGISIKSANYLFDCGCDILTGGNHSFRRKEIYSLLISNNYILRPFNISKSSPGKGICKYETDKFSIIVINLLGQVYLDANTSPFQVIDYILKTIKNKLIIIDFHAEATGEKGALVHHLDGRISALVGTHTHIQTNDAKILKNGTGFITDVGMVGPEDSVLGVDAKCVIRKITTKMPTKFEVPNTHCIFNAVLLYLDEVTGKCIKISTISLS